MRVALAYAESGDSGAMNLTKVLGGLGIIAVAALLAAVLIAVSRSRGHRYGETIMAAAILWAVISAGSLIYSAASRLNWSEEYARRIESGYFDPTDATDKPKLPITLWCGLGIAYTALLAWSFSSKRLSPPEQ